MSLSQCNAEESNKSVEEKAGAGAPNLSWLRTKFCLKKHVSQKSLHQFRPIWSLFSIFFQKSPKNCKLTIYQKRPNICNFLSVLTCNTLKESSIHIEFEFRQKKYDLIEEQKLKKNSNYFVKFDADHFSSSAHYSNLCQKYSKLSSLVLWKCFEIKSHERGAHYIYGPRNGAPNEGRLSNGGRAPGAPLPSPIRVDTL